MNNLEFIGKCANGINVFNRLNSHLHKEVSQNILKEALLKLSPNEVFHKKVIDMKRVIGKKSCVTINENDEIIYAIRKGRNGPTPMVKNREPVDCSYLTVVLKRIEENSYLLISTYIGDVSEPEPWDLNFYNPFTWEKRDNIDEEAYQKSLAFWKTHALIYDENEISLLLS